MMFLIPIHQHLCHAIAEALTDVGLKKNAILEVLATRSKSGRRSETRILQIVY